MVRCLLDGFSASLEQVNHKIAAISLTLKQALWIFDAVFRRHLIANQ